MRIQLTLTIERRKKPTEEDATGALPVVGTFRESKAAPARARAAGRGSVGFRATDFLLGSERDV